MKSFSGKYLSLLGASTSTYNGISNNELYNTTITKNEPYYPQPEWLNASSDTWWMRTIQRLDMQLCVNNSWGGACVTTIVDDDEKAGCMKRATQLHNDTLGIEPDIIILIIGGNDALRGYEIGAYHSVSDIYDADQQTYIGDCTKFGQAYATMVHKVKNRYPNAEIYVCSMLHWEVTEHHKGLLEYNDVIQKIAEEFRVTYVDFYNHTKISPETASIYLHTDGVHPNKYGFEEMSNCLLRVLQSK